MADRNPLRKLPGMVKELKSMLADLDPQSTTSVTSEELKGLDDYQRAKYALNTALSEARGDVDKLCDLRRAQGETRSAESIGLQSANTRKIKELQALWNELKKVLIKDGQSKKKKLSEEELATRNDATVKFASDIADLANKNSGVNSVSPEDIKLAGDKKEDRAKKLRAGRDKRAGGRGRKNRHGDKDDPVFTEVGAQSEQEQQFMDKVDANNAAQDEVLDEINKGLDELKGLSLAMNSALKVQGAILEDIDEKMDADTEKLKTANKKVAELLEKSGGASRWCPMFICLVILLALVGYMLKIF